MSNIIGETRNSFQLLTKIQKRDGTLVDFDASKITSAIFAAGNATGEFDRQCAQTLALRALSIIVHLCGSKTPSVEQVQDVVEDVLLASDYKQAAKAYIIYREQHARMREIISVADINLVEQYLDKLDWKVSENSNMAYSLQGLNNYISSEISKVYWLNKIYPEEVRQAHLGGEMHIHDLNLLSVYCVGWDLRDLLVSGFCGAKGKSESRPAKHFRAALGQVVNFFYTLQGEAAGAQAFSNFDTLLSPFIRFDGLDAREVKQALQEFVFNLNVPTRVGFQTPFTNITLDLKVSPIFAHEPIIIGGEIQDVTYGDFQHEMDMFNCALFEVLSEGDAKGRVFTFPIPTVNISKDFEWESTALAPLWESTARYGIPYFSNFVNSDLSPEDARSMCCRLRLDLRNLDRRGGGLFGANPLTGSIGVVTINMPRLGFCSSTESEFFQGLNSVMEKAKNSLEIKRNALEKFSDRNLYPYTKFFLRNIKERFGQYWHNHFSTIGLVGMNEACLNLLGSDIGSDRGRDFAIRTLDVMREKLQEFQEMTGQIYNLEATPAEGAGYRLARIDTELFPDIITGNRTTDGQPFYNNSTQLPVNYTDDIFEVFDLQDEIQTRYTGGTVIHVYSGDSQSDSESVKQFVKTVCDQYKLPYFTYTPTFSICPEHGYLNGKMETCPRCHKTCEVYSRVVGYLRPVSQWNDGKSEEFRRRPSFDIGDLCA